MRQVNGFKTVDETPCRIDRVCRDIEVDNKKFHAVLSEELQHVKILLLRCDKARQDDESERTEDRIGDIHCRIISELTTENGCVAVDL